MKVIRGIKPMQEISAYLRRTGKKIGLVPTMGFLHEGHVALMLAAKDECDIVIVSIFVNPAQFLPKEDFKAYPRDLSRDYHVCKHAGVDYIFYPDEKDMYGEDYKTYVNVNDISDKLEGKYRPGHFTGVATVVLKLFNITKPVCAYFGQKDAQQAVVIRKMVKDLNADLNVRICETVREESGLAMSSRNSYLKDEQKKNAAVLYKTLQMGKSLVLSNEYGTAREIKKKMKEYAETNSHDCSLQYIAITDNDNLKKIKNIPEYEGEVLISLAAYFGKTRLIDNILFYKINERQN
ncbi:MAG: pantoate--beta-alanine ligase [Ignavibacteria bacterium]|nr:pantoate--beta-alanine ligase [Ignavibacteria bacterium]